MNTFLRIGVLLAALLAVAQVQAAVTVFTDRPSWEAAVGGGFATEDFDGVAPYNMGPGPNAAGLIDIFITGADAGSNAIIDVGGGNHLYQGDVDTSSGRIPSIVFLGTFPLGISGFGADWVDTLTAGQLTVTIESDTINFSDYLVFPGDGFLGFVADAPFTTATFGTESADGVELFDMDNISINAFSATPTPVDSSMLLLSIVAGLMCLKRKVNA